MSSGKNTGMIYPIRLNTPCLMAALVLLSLVILAGTAGCTQPQIPPQGQQTEEQKSFVEVTATQPDAQHIVVTYQGGPNMQKVMELQTTVTDSTGKVQTKSVGDRLGTTPITIRGTNTLEGDFSGQDHVVVLGYFSDGSNRVMLDTTV